MTNEYPDRPRVAVGALVLHGGRLLVVERAKAPGEGVWALPGGSVELGETMADAAEREVREETSLLVRARDVVYAFDAVIKDAGGRVQFHYAIVDFVCEYVSGSVTAGGDAKDARLVTREEFANLRSSRFTVDLLRARTNFLDDTTDPPALRRPV
jgi:8-oxo-dGTP diphosphatase